MSHNERYNLSSIYCCFQQNGTFDNYFVRLRKLAATCEFGQLTDELIRDRIVCGIADNATTKKLLQESDLTLNKCLDLCRATETSTNQLNTMLYDHVADTTVYAVSSIRDGGSGAPRLGAFFAPEGAPSPFPAAA